MIGNTSSGITEAASFKKYVLNLGDRQKGRPTGSNVLSISFEHNEIINFSKKYFGKTYLGSNIYYKKSPSKKILEVLKKKFLKKI